MSICHKSSLKKIKKIKKTPCKNNSSRSSEPRIQSTCSKYTEWPEYLLDPKLIRRHLFYIHRDVWCFALLSHTNYKGIWREQHGFIFTVIQKLLGWGEYWRLGAYNRRSEVICKFCLSFTLTLIWKWAGERNTVFWHNMSSEGGKKRERDRNKIKRNSSRESGPSCLSVCKSLSLADYKKRRKHRGRKYNLRK